jgi:hypothetical protein
MIESYFSSSASKVVSSNVGLRNDLVPVDSVNRLELPECLVRFKSTVLLLVPKPFRWERVPVTVGVPLLLDIMDMAEVGLGVGLGLGGPSESVSSEPENKSGATRSSAFACNKE